MAHRDAYLNASNGLLKKNSTLMTRDKRELIIQLILEHKKGASINSLKKRLSTIDNYTKKCDVLELNGQPPRLIVKPEIGEDGGMPSIDSMRAYSCVEEAFDVIKGEHYDNEHCRGVTLFKCVAENYVNIPREFCKVFTDTCPYCLETIKTKKQRTAGHQPIIKRGLGKRGPNHVHIITMGGTIDKDYPRLTSGYAFEFGEEPAVSRILNAHPNLGISHDVTSVCKKDSQEIDDADRRKLMFEILRIVGETNEGGTMPSRKRIVVTHGTDTMIETAKYVQEQLGQNPPENNMQISIAFTGATKPERFVDSDAAFNLGSAISVTAFCNEGISVMICMNGNVAAADKCGRLESGVFCATE